MTNRPDILINRRSVLNLPFSVKHSTAGQISMGTTDFDFERTQAFSYFLRAYIFKFSDAAIFGRRLSSGTFRGHEIKLNSDGTIRVTFQNGAGNQIRITTPSSAPTTEWLDILMTYSGNSLASGINLYINGVSTSFITNNDTLTDTIVDASAITNIGGRSSTGVRFNGLITDVRVYDKELTASEAMQLSMHGIDPDSNLYAKYKYLAGSGTTLSDSSGNGRDGTIMSLDWSNKTPSKARVTSTTRSDISATRSSV